MDNLPVALVTGSSSGFGLLTAVELARAGHRVFASLRDPARSARLEAAAAEAGVTVEVVRLDVAEPASIAPAVAELERRAGRIDVLVNNAGFAVGGFFEDVSDAELRAQFETNFFGLAAVTRAVIPGMRERRQGRVINVSSIAGRVANPGMSAYCASKFAVEGLSEALRYELLPFGVHVVLVEPGSFPTDIFTRNKRVAAAAGAPGSAYARMSRGLEDFVDRRIRTGRSDPRTVARLIVKAAAAPRPRLRYLVGNARAGALARAIVPTRLYEEAVTRFLARVGK